MVIISRFASYRILRKGFDSELSVQRKPNHLDYARFADEELEELEQGGGTQEAIFLQKKRDLSVVAEETGGRFLGLDPRTLPH